MGQQARNSHRSIVAVPGYLAMVLVQDGLDMAEEYPKNPVHTFLLADEEFR